MNFSKITASLFIGTTPSLKDQEFLKAQGVTLIINMRFERRPHRASSIKTIWLPTIDSPLIWIPVRVLKRGVDAALAIINTEGKVYVHCHGGVHRAVAMGCCILIALGYSPLAAIALIKKQRQRADPDIWYIHRQIIKFAEQYRQYTNSNPDGDFI